MDDADRQVIRELMDDFAAECLRRAPLPAEEVKRGLTMLTRELTNRFGAEALDVIREQVQVMEDRVSVRRSRSTCPYCEEEHEGDNCRPEARMVYE